jgi:hypothetical protein
VVGRAAESALEERLAASKEAEARKAEAARLRRGLVWAGGRLARDAQARGLKKKATYSLRVRGIESTAASALLLLLLLSLLLPRRGGGGGGGGDGGSPSATRRHDQARRRVAGAPFSLCQALLSRSRFHSSSRSRCVTRPQ